MLQGNITTAGNSVRDHLFISYAGEDLEFAVWLTLKLTSYGYSVWCDKFKQLGGESYPKDIDEAIKDKTFRVLAIMSRSSNSKDNPLKERTTAMSIAKQRGERDFVIPLNIDGIAPSELNWMMSDITFIPFYKGWAIGLEQLIKKLNSINAPKPLPNGKEIIKDGFLNTDLLNKIPEQIYINNIPFLKIPDVIKVFESGVSLADAEKKEWAFYKANNKTVLSFNSPSDRLIREYYLRHLEDISINSEYAYEIPIRNVISNLLLKSIHLICYKSGLNILEEEEKSLIYFPKNIPEKNKIKFVGYDGKKTWVRSNGERKRNSINGITRYQFHLSPKFKIKKELDGTYFAGLRVGLFITDLEGIPLKAKQANSRRKSICKDWWNYEWLNRYLGVLSFLANGKENIVIGEQPEGQVVLSTKFVEEEVPFGIDESGINKVVER